MLDKPKFDQYADTYNDLHRESTRIAGEGPDYFAAYKVGFLSDHLRKSAHPSTDILDFGCGVGNCLAHLVRTFPNSRIHGLDVSSASIDAAREKFPSVNFGVIEASLPLDDSSIDVAIAVGVYHHMVPAERQKWTDELRRIIRPGGILYIFEHNPLNPITQKIVRECPFDDDAILLPKRESVGLMRASGFKDISVDYVMFFPRVLSVLRPLESLLTGIPFGAQYVACGRA
jgi:SAM-dependent methyltransferase